MIFDPGRGENHRMRDGRPSRWDCPLLENAPIPVAGPHSCPSYPCLSHPWLERIPLVLEHRSHPHDLLRREHDQRGVIRIVHIVHKHIAIWTIAAGNARERWRSLVRTSGIRGVSDVICAGAIFAVTPDVAQV